MSNFKTHFTTSVALGTTYGGVGIGIGISPFHCAIGSGLFCMAGILPDIDSHSTSHRESASILSILAVIAVINAVERRLTVEEGMFLAIVVYVVSRMLLSLLVKSRITIHRGMFHTILVALILSELIYLNTSGSSLVRSYKSGGVFCGYLIHLLIDELAAVEWKRGTVKQSFGTALKFFGRNQLLNIIGITIVAVLGYVVILAPWSNW